MEKNRTQPIYNHDDPIMSHKVSISHNSDKIKEKW